MLARYGRALGICFQLVDDLLDFTARESELGKPVLSDLKEGKLTLPLILLLPRVARRGAAAGRDGARGPQLRPRLGRRRSSTWSHAEGTLEEVARDGRGLRRPGASAS